MGYSTPVFSPTGGMKISAQDLAKYMIMHMNYGEAIGEGWNPDAESYSYSVANLLLSSESIQ